MSHEVAKSKDEVLRDFEARGESLSAWARRNGVSVNTLRAVLMGKNSGRINKGHRVMVALGMKPGSSEAGTA